MVAFDEFKSYYALADQLMEAMTPEQLAECLRLLPPHLADCRSRFGEIPRQNLLDLLGVTAVKDSQARVLRDGMELVGYLVSVRDGWEDHDAPLHEEPSIP